MAFQAPVLTTSQYVTRMCILYFRIFQKCFYHPITVSIKIKVDIWQSPVKISILLKVRKLARGIVSYVLQQFN